MTDDPTWRPGATVKQSDLAETLGLTGTHGMDVAVGLDPNGGPTVVLLRFGGILGVLSADGAADLAKGLAECAQAAVRHDHDLEVTQ